MEYIVNELSLTGQYGGVEEFLDVGLPSFMGVMNDIRNADSSLHILKKADLYDSNVTDDVKLKNLIWEEKYRIYDSLKKFKSQLADLILGGTFWDETFQQSIDTKYFRINDNLVSVAGSSVAEAFVREDCLVSFRKSDYEADSVYVTDEKEERAIPNFYRERQVLDFLLECGQLPYKLYIKNAFNRRLNFNEISPREGLNLITRDNFHLFESAFHKFETLAWDQIRVDDGLDYKEFHKNRYTKDYFRPDQWDKTIMKFRINDKIRCFGYRMGNVFFVLRIDLDHRLSDLG